MAERTSTPARPAHLEPSELGTKQYWDKLYTTEITNHAADSADEGTVWFDDSDAEAKMVGYLESLCDGGDDEARETPAKHQRTPPLDRGSASVLDLGCGNGSMLFALRDEGWAGPLLGVDYSEMSVELARRIAQSRRQRQDEEEPKADMGTAEEQERQEGAGDAQNDEESTQVVKFAVWDVLSGPLDVVSSGDLGTSCGWDIILDKGTFDAVSLSREEDGQGRRICEGYRNRVLQLLRPGGICLVTSCNWTETELEAWFVGPDSDGTASGREYLSVAGKVEHRSFSFGGVKGQTVSTLCFLKQKYD